MIEPKDRTVLITGGSEGIGFELAKQMSEQGSKVIICGRSVEKLKNAKSICGSLATIACDVSSEEGRRALTETINRKYQNLNMLVNNAGIVYRYLLATTGDLTERITNEWKTNYLAPVILTQNLFPLLKKNRGTVVNICTGLSYVPLSIEPNYCATKAALMSMTQSMRVQYRKSGVRAVAVFYPEVNTAFQEGHPTERAISPQLAAKEALKQLNQGKLDIHVKAAKLIYKLSRLMPGKALQMLNGSLPAEIENIIKTR